MLARDLTSITVALSLTAAGLLPAPASAESTAESTSVTDIEERAPGEDESLYRCGNARGKVVVTFKPGTSLEDLVTWAMGFSCKNFVFSPQLGGRRSEVAVIAPSSMSPGQAWRLFLVALQTMNLSVVAQGEVLTIVEAPQAKRQPVRLHDGAPPARAEMTRVLIRAEHVPLEELAAALEALRSKDGEVVVLSRAGVALVTDYGTHIAGMRRLLEQIDRPGAEERLYLVRVRHVDVAELLSTLEAVLGSTPASPATAAPAAPTPPAPPARMIADPRTQSLVVVASEAGYQRVLALVRRLDHPMGEDGGNIYMILLEHGDAEEMAQTLGSLLGNRPAPTGGGGARPEAAAPRAPEPLALSPGVQGDVRVAFDRATNALLLLASARDYLGMREIIRQLDAPRRQVTLEAVILEVSIDDSRDLGVSLHGGVGADGLVWLTGLQHTSLQSASLARSSTLTGLLGGVFGAPLAGSESLLGKSIPSFGVLFHALARNRRIELLSSPHITTSDNVPAIFRVGQNIPVLGGVISTADPASPLRRPVERHSVGLELKVTPHINNQDQVRLDIEIDIADLLPDPGELGPSWTERSIRNTVVVHDQESLVIGGLVFDRQTSVESKVPLLGDLPVLGHLFKYTERTRQKQNLVILLTPYVLSDAADAARIAESKLRERTEFARAFSNLDDMEYRPTIDHRRTRGLVEEIHRAVARSEREAEALRRHEAQDRGPEEGPIEP